MITTVNGIKNNDDSNSKWKENEHCEKREYKKR